MIEKNEEELRFIIDAFFFFSKVFYEQPTEDFLSFIISSSKENQWFVSGEKSNSAMKTLSSIDPTSFQAIFDDYYQLFIGPEEILAHPYASMYLDHEKHLFTEETMRVEKFYEECGMEYQDKEKEPADHIGLELMFLGFLFDLFSSSIKKSKDSEQSKLLHEKTKKFLFNHLLTWAGDFLDLVETNAKTTYYKSLSILCSEFLIYLHKDLKH